MRKKLKPVFSLFSAVQVLLSMVLIFIVSTFYMYFLNQSWGISIAVGFLTLVFSFYFLVFIPKRMEKQVYLLKELQKYATNMTFYLQSGYNVLKALEYTKESVDRQIRKDIEKTIKILKKEARLETNHFKKYRFSSINIFHEILKIKYDVGGNAKDMFTKANKSINFEIIKRDELYRRKMHARNRVYMMIAMSLSIPLILVFSAKDLYSTYLSLGTIAIGLNVLLFVSALINLYFLQRASTDIDLH